MSGPATTNSVTYSDSEIASSPGRILDDEDSSIKEDFPVYKVSERGTEMVGRVIHDKRFFIELLYADTQADLRVAGNKVQTIVTQ